MIAAFCILNCLLAPPYRPAYSSLSLLCSQYSDVYPFLSQFAQVHIFKTYFSMIHFNITDPPTFRFPKLSLHCEIICISPTSCAHFSIHSLVTLTVSKEEYKLGKSSLCNYLKFPILPFGSRYSVHTSSINFSAHVLLESKTPSFIHI